MGQNLWSNLFKKNGSLTETPGELEQMNSQQTSPINIIEPFYLYPDQDYYKQSIMSNSSYRKSDIFTSKEEFIFVFGGIQTKEQGPMHSIEVFDTVREIWREFNCSKFEKIKGNDLSYSVSNIQALQFTYLASSSLNEKIYLLGGIDENGETISSI
jgi:hypothetical protein